MSNCWPRYGRNWRKRETARGYGLERERLADATAADDRRRRCVAGRGAFGLGLATPEAEFAIFPRIVATRVDGGAVDANRPCLGLPTRSRLWGVSTSELVNTARGLMSSVPAICSPARKYAIEA